jgi:dUTP pyrophosphatase
MDFQKFLSNLYLKNSFFEENKISSKIMLLCIFVDSEDKKLKQIYVDAANNHNKKIVEDPFFYDAGFDLYLPLSFNSLEKGTRFFNSLDVPVNKVDFKIKCCAKIYNRSGISNKMTYTPFYTYARSSISKTPLRLANNQGIIDAGYRGPIIGMFDCLKKDSDFYMEPYSRILQICAPNLIPIYVEIVDTFEELGPSTARGSGGIGSTGI